MWAVGDEGTILFYDGNSFTRQESGVSSNLQRVFAYDNDHAWIVGDKGTILEYDNGAWKSLPNPHLEDLNGIFVTGPREFWAVGDKGIILHYDGKTLENQGGINSNNLHSIAVFGTPGWKIVAAVGDNGEILQKSEKHVDYYVTIANETNWSYNLSITNWETDYIWSDIYFTDENNNNLGRDIVLYPKGSATLHFYEQKFGTLFDPTTGNFNLTWTTLDGGDRIEQRMSHAYCSMEDIISEKAETYRTFPSGLRNYTLTASPWKFVSQKEYNQVDKMSENIVKRMGLDPNQGVGKVFQGLLKLGLKAVFGKSSVQWVKNYYNTTLMYDDLQR